MDDFLPLAIAPGLGLLVGLQREWSAPHIAGIRTFALITVLGAFLGQIGGSGWLLPAGLIAVTAIIILAGLLKMREEVTGPGLTTATAALLMYGVGAALSQGLTGPAVAVGGGVAVLLHWKRPLHFAVERMGEQDLRGVIQLVLIGLVILPVLPDTEYGPYGVLNPFEIWLLVVLIVGISLCGYIVFKFLGTRVGTLLGGILGGIVSSTATTVSYARHSRNAGVSANLCAVVLMIASTVVYGRVLFEIGVVAPAMLREVAGPLIAMMGILALLSTAVYLLVRNQPGDMPLPSDPSQLRAAIVFGTLYAVVLLAVGAAQEHLGREALYVVAAVSGLTEMDAITLSSAQMVKAGRIDAETGWRLILVGSMANLVFKGAIVAFLGGRKLFLYITVLFAVAIAGGTGLVLFWPGGT